MLPAGLIPTSLPLHLPLGPTGCISNADVTARPPLPQPAGPDGPSAADSPTPLAHVTHGLMAVPRVYRALAETGAQRHAQFAARQQQQQQQQGQGDTSAAPAVVFPLTGPAPTLPTAGKTKAFVSALAGAWGAARDADVPTISTLLNASLRGVVASAHRQSEVSAASGELPPNAYTALASAAWTNAPRTSAAASSAAATSGGCGDALLESPSSAALSSPTPSAPSAPPAGNGSSSAAKAPTSRDPLLILEWLETLNAVVNGVGTEAFDPERLWPLRDVVGGGADQHDGLDNQQISDGTTGSSLSAAAREMARKEAAVARKFAHFANGAEARAARAFAKSALERAKRRVALTKQSGAHFGTAAALRGPATLVLLLELLGTSPGDIGSAAAASSVVGAAALGATASSLSSPFSTTGGGGGADGSDATYYAEMLGIGNGNGASSSVSSPTATHQQQHSFQGATEAALFSSSPASSSALLGSCEALEAAVAEAALTCVYNLLHPPTTVSAQKIPMTMRLPYSAPAAYGTNDAALVPHNSGGEDEGEGGEHADGANSAASQQRHKDPCQTHVAARAAPFQWREVRSEIGRLRSGPPPPLIEVTNAKASGNGGSTNPLVALPLTAGGVIPPCAAAVSSGTVGYHLRTILIDAFVVRRERSLPTVQKLTKLNIYRPLFALLTLHSNRLQLLAASAASAAESTNDNASAAEQYGGTSATMSAAASAAVAKVIATSSSARIVHLCALLIAALGGATKQSEEHSAADALLQTLHGCGVPSALLVSGGDGAGGGAASGGGGADSEGDDDGGGGGGDDDGDGDGDGGGKKKKKKKSKKKGGASELCGGCSSGPMRLAAVTGLAKTGTLARLGGAMAALVAALEVAVGPCCHHPSNASLSATPSSAVGAILSTAAPSSSLLVCPQASIAMSWAVPSIGNAPIVTAGSNSGARALQCAPLAPHTFAASVMAALATVAVGPPNISFLHRKGLVSLVGSLMSGVVGAFGAAAYASNIQHEAEEAFYRRHGIAAAGATVHSSALSSPSGAITSTAASSSTTVVGICGPRSAAAVAALSALRWATELVYRLLGPTAAKAGGGMMLPQLTAEELTGVKEGFVKQCGGLGLLAAAASLGAVGSPSLAATAPSSSSLSLAPFAIDIAAEWAQPHTAAASARRHTAFPSAPLFCAACDVLQLLLAVPSIGGLVGGGGSSGALLPRGLAPLIADVARAALSDSVTTESILKTLIAAMKQQQKGDGKNSSSLTGIVGPILVAPALRGTLRRGGPRFSASAWAAIVAHVNRMLDVKELPVGSDNELAWFPPPELVDELRRQQQASAEATAKAAAAAAAAAAASGAGGGDTANDAAVCNEDESDDDNGAEEGEEEEDALAEEISAVGGLADFSPELNLPSNNSGNGLGSSPSLSSSSAYAAAPSSFGGADTAANAKKTEHAPPIPSHTSILGIASVHHIKPFSSPRPLPSSSAVINSSPLLAEPLLACPDMARCEAVKAQLNRLLYAAASCSCNAASTAATVGSGASGSPVGSVVVYDDLTRSVALPKSRVASLIGKAPAAVALLSGGQSTALHCTEEEESDSPRSPLSTAAAAKASSSALPYAGASWLRPPLGVAAASVQPPTPPPQQPTAHSTVSIPAPPPAAAPHSSAVPLLSFDSAFESGNLKRAVHVMGGTEYDLILHTDVNTNSFVQWFYFAVGNITPNVAYRFNILNMEKESSTFNDGQRPLLFSERRYEATQRRVGWTREGHSVAYFKNSLARRGRERYVPQELMEFTSAAAGAGGGSAAGNGGGGASADGGEAKKSGTAAKTAGTGAKKAGSGSAVSSATAKRRSDASTTSVSSSKGGAAGTGASASSGKTGAKSGSATGKASGATSGSGKKSAVSSSSSASSSDSASQSTYYTLTFVIVFPPFAGDRVYLTNCYPYTYSDLIGYCRRLITSHEEACAYHDHHCSNTSASAASKAAAAGGANQNPPPKAPTVPPFSLFVQSLCPTLSGNATPLLTITQLKRGNNSSSSNGAYYSEEEIRRRPVVLLTARVHPGESNASYMIKGCLDLLLSPTSAVARQLREQFVFKIIPMLNPDGVINGNHRCGLAGTDLNRGYHRPSRWKNPTIFYLKALAFHLKRTEGRTLLLYTDFHGHSRCHNGVIYGCGEGNTLQSLFAGLVPASPQASLAIASHLSGGGGGGGAGGEGETSSVTSTTAASLHGYAPHMAAAAALILHHHRSRGGGGGGAAGLTGGATALRKLSKNADYVAESFGFNKTTHPHPFCNNNPTAATSSSLSASLSSLVSTYGAPERLLPLLLQYFCPYFSYGSSTFTVQKGKRNTGRVVFYRQLGVRMSYTVEASMMGGVGCDFFTSIGGGSNANGGWGSCDDFPVRVGPGAGAPSTEAPPFAGASFSSACGGADDNAFADSEEAAEAEALLRFVCARRPDLAPSDPSFLLPSAAEGCSGGGSGGAAAKSHTLSLEQQRRMAAQWAIQNDQRSGLSPFGAVESAEALVGAGGAHIESPLIPFAALANASNAAHFAPKHYASIGMMLLKALCCMWGASTAHRSGMAFLQPTAAAPHHHSSGSGSTPTSTNGNGAPHHRFALGSSEDPYYRLVAEARLRSAADASVLPHAAAALQKASAAATSTAVAPSPIAPAPNASTAAAHAPSLQELLAAYIVDPSAAAQMAGVPPSVGTAMGHMQRSLAEEAALKDAAAAKKKKKKGTGKKKKSTSSKKTTTSGSTSTKKKPTAKSTTSAAGKGAGAKSATSTATAKKGTSAAPPPPPSSPLPKRSGAASSASVGFGSSAAHKRTVSSSSASLTSPASAPSLRPSGASAAAALVGRTPPPGTASGGARGTLASARQSNATTAAASRPSTTANASSSVGGGGSAHHRQKRSAACTPPLSPQLAHSLPVALITPAQPPSSPAATDCAGGGADSAASGCLTPPPPPLPSGGGGEDEEESTEASSRAGGGGALCFSGSYASATRKGSQVPSAAPRHSSASHNGGPLLANDGGEEGGGDDEDDEARSATSAGGEVDDNEDDENEDNDNDEDGDDDDDADGEDDADDGDGDEDDENEDGDDDENENEDNDNADADEAAEFVDEEEAMGRGGPTGTSPASLAIRNLAAATAAAAGGHHLLAAAAVASPRIAVNMWRRRLPLRGGAFVGTVAGGSAKARARRPLRHAPQGDVIAFCQMAYVQGPVLL